MGRMALPPLPATQDAQSEGKRLRCRDLKERIDTAYACDDFERLPKLVGEYQKFDASNAEINALVQNLAGA